MTENREPVFRAEHVTKCFPAGRNRTLQAVEDVSLEVFEGECVGVVGESGCGKSTLARMAAGIEPVTGGKITLLGREITRPGGRMCAEIRNDLQIVLQNPSGAFSPRMRVGEFLREPFRNGLAKESGREGNGIFRSRKKERERMDEACARLLGRVELDGSYMEKFPHQLSGGEQQRVVLARTLAVRPALLICDEATSALDVSTQAQIAALLWRIQREEKLSILLICHDLALAQSLSRRIVVMYLGMVVEEVRGVELAAAKHPYTRALLDSVFSVDGERPREIKGLGGEPPDPIDRPKGCPFAGRCAQARARCHREKPELTTIGEGHKVRCVNW